jgi:hypothetical protein
VSIQAQSALRTPSGDFSTQQGSSERPQEARLRTHTGPEGDASGAPHLGHPNALSMHTMPRAALRPYVRLREGCPRLSGNSYVCSTTATTYSKDEHLCKGIFQYNNVLCSGMELQSYGPEHPYNQRFELQDLLPVLPVLGNINICSTSMMST